MKDERTNLSSSFLFPLLKKLILQWHEKMEKGSQSSKDFV